MSWHEEPPTLDAELPARSGGWAASGTAWVAAGVATSTVAAAALLLPWVALGRRRFSSLDLISAASALEIIEGDQKRIVVVAWMVVPLLLATGYLLAATGRRRWFAWVLLPLGPTYLAVAVAMSTNTMLRTEWGLYVGATAGVASSLIAVVLLVQARVTA